VHFRVHDVEVVVLAYFRLIMAKYYDLHICRARQATSHKLVIVRRTYEPLYSIQLQIEL
jgi:hypothetical protein